MGVPLQSFRDLIVWQKSVTLVVEVYALTRTFPKTEMYGLSAQMRRAAVSIPSNIAEGRRRGTRQDFRHFLLNALGSGAELETQLEITQRLELAARTKIQPVASLLGEVQRMLSRMISTLTAM